MRVKRPSSPSTLASLPLRALIGPLNFDSQEGAFSSWWEGLPPLARLIGQDECKAALGRLKKDVLSIIDATEPADMEANCRAVVKKIEGMDIKPSLGVYRWKSKAREWISSFHNMSLGKPFDVNGIKLFTFESPQPLLLEEIFYWNLFIVLRNGEFERLRKCPNCHIFHAAEDLKRKFCSNHCKDEYNNRSRRREGYFTDLWRKKRELALKRAKSLLQRGVPPGRVCQQTKLTARILRKNGLLR